MTDPYTLYLEEKEQQKAREFVEKHLTTIPPEGCDLKVGDVVTYTNEYGVKFHDLVVIGFDKGPEEEYLYGRYIYLSKDSYWFPNHRHELKKQEKTNVK